MGMPYGFDRVRQQVIGLTDFECVFAPFIPDGGGLMCVWGCMAQRCVVLCSHVRIEPGRADDGVGRAGHPDCARGPNPAAPGPACGDAHVQTHALQKPSLPGPSVCSLKNYEEVFTSEHWMVRVYRVLPESNREAGLPNPNRVRAAVEVPLKARQPSGVLK